MERCARPPWSVARSLALLAAIFAIVVGATLPTAVAASAGVGEPIQLCSGERIFVMADGSGQPAHHEPGPADSLKCAACLAGGFVALIPPPPPALAAPHRPGPDAVPLPALSDPANAVRLAPRPPSTAPPHA